MDSKSAYPYITKFKKELFKSFISVKRKDIKNFYYRNHDKLIEFYQHFNHNLLKNLQLDLETIFWFLLLRKYLKEDKKVNREELFKFIKKCEVHNYEEVGFKSSPYSDKNPDIYSTYLALSCLKILGLLNEYLISEKQTQIKGEIKNFVLAHKKGNNFIHCLNKECDICKNLQPARILHYVLEIFTLLGADIRSNRDQFRSYLTDKKRDSTVIFRFLCFKYLDLDSEVKDKDLQFLQQQQKESGGFSFNQEADIYTTFWVVYILELYSWLLDYNSTGIYSFIYQKLEEKLILEENWDYSKICEVSKLVILLSLIWQKFIDEIERVLFKQLEKENYIDINHLKTTFGFAGYIEEIVSYINLNYNFNLEVVDNEVEFINYINKLSLGKKKFLEIFYEKLKNNSIISLTDLFKNYRTLNYEPLKLKEEIFPIINEMVERRFFIGNIRTKKIFLGFKTKYLFYLNYLPKKIIISDMDLNTERIFEEKEKLEDIKNDIYNMTLKLRQVTSQIREEIESYLLIDEIDYAKERLKFITKDALMEADFLNENIENSFNEILKYINIQASLGSEISQWNKLYSVLQKRLSDVSSYLRGKIQEREDLRNLNDLLENLKEKLVIIEEDLKRKLDSFRKLFCETFEKEYDNEKLNLIMLDLDKISQNVRKYDEIIYNVSQRITTKEKKIVKKHKKIVANWIKIKDYYNSEFNYFIDGFHFFNNKLQNIEEVNDQIKVDIFEINKKAKSKIIENKFQDAFNITKKETDLLLKNRLEEIKEIQLIIKQEIKKNQKLYILYRHLQDKLESMESNIIELFANQVKDLKNKIIEERNRSKIEDFDNFVSQKISDLKSQLNVTKTDLEKFPNLKINEVVKKFDDLKSDYDKINKVYIKKL
ncbi:MAG: prenyltransferase/squalene oxidase repeat-containing protein, partial [Candidatus Odinarchaeota archaeon]